uniref:Uncharacterized protein n=1 Tax=Aegilops tauschii subsp. strangulata TaxID=200361 RepID=A0A453L4M2_AEGTS
LPASAGAGAGAGHRHGSPDHAADTGFARLLSGHHHHQHHPEMRDKPPRPAASHFAEDAANSMASQQQLMYQSQQQMAAMEGLFRTAGSGGTDPVVAGVGGNDSLLRQSSSPAGFLNHLNMDNGYYTPKPRRLREHAQGGHGRRRRRGRVQERRRAAEGAAELLVAAGVGDVADLGDGRRGDGRRQQRRRRGRQQRRLLRRHPRVPGGRPLRRRRLGRALAVPVALAADVRRPPAGRQQAFAVAGDCGHREVPPVPGLGAVQDPRQARLRHPPPQHRRTGPEDEDQRADTEAAGARSQHGEANQHLRHAGSRCRLHQGAPDASEGTSYVCMYVCMYVFMFR